MNTKLMYFTGPTLGGAVKAVLLRNLLCTNVKIVQIYILLQV